MSWIYPISPLSNISGGGRIFSLIVVRVFSSASPSSAYWFMPGKETPVTFIGLFLCFFRFEWHAYAKINWSGSCDDNSNFFYPTFTFISFAGVFVYVRSTHGGFLKTKFIGLLPIRGVDPSLGWFFEQPLLNGFSTDYGSFLPQILMKERLRIL